MKDKKKIILVCLIIIIVIAIVILLILHKKKNNNIIIDDNTNIQEEQVMEEPEDDSEEEKEDETVRTEQDGYYREVKSMDDNYYAEYFPINIKDDELKLYNQLVTKNNTFGLYLNKSINIKNISNDDMIEFALINYINDNKLELGNSACFMDEESEKFTGKPAYADDPELDCSVKPITKDALDKYIKEKFNTTRTFTSDGQLKILTISQEPVKYIYDSKSKSYYYGVFPQSGGVDQLSRYLTKVETKGNDIIFYDKAAYCSAGSWGSMYCMPTQNGENKYFEIFEDDYSEEKDELMPESGAEGLSYDLNYDYIFEHYKFPQYKHTFTKTNGKYYWVSTELVK